MGNAPSSTAPWGAQIALVNTDLICYRQAPDSLGGNTYGGQNISVSVTAPLTAGSGQQIYFSDLAGSFQLPDVYSQLGSQLRSSHYKLSYTATFDSTDVPNSRATSQNAWQISGSVWKPLTEQSIPIPASGGISSPLGPVRMGAVGSVTDFRINNLTYVLNFANQNNEATSQPITVTCGRTDFLSDNYLKPIIASTVSGSALVPQYRLNPANGVRGAFPKTGFREKSVTANLDISCNWGDYNGFNLTVTGTGPAVTAAGYQISLKNWQNVWTLPASWFGIVMTRGIHGFSFKTDVDGSGRDLPGSGIGLQISNGSPSEIDISRQFTPSDSSIKAPLSADRYINVTDYHKEALPFPLPQRGDLTIGPITAGKSYDVFGTSVSNIQGDMYIYSFASNVDFKDLAFKCTSRPNALLRTAMIF